MQWHHSIQVLTEQLKATPLLEWLGVGFGVAEVLLARSNKVLLYPAGIISVLISTYIFYHSGLYAESALNLYYFVMSAYGWWWWVKRKDHPAPPITRTSAREWRTVALIVVGAFLLLYLILRYRTDSTVPAADAWVSATAWAGMWLLAKRKLENWLLLNLSNAFAIPLLFYKGLPLYGLLTVFLFLIAISGYLNWKEKLQSREYGRKASTSGNP